VELVGMGIHEIIESQETGSRAEVWNKLFREGSEDLREVRKLEVSDALPLGSSEICHLLADFRLVV
jgi:hypothetical protein